MAIETDLYRLHDMQIERLVPKKIAAFISPIDCSFPRGPSQTGCWCQDPKPRDRVYHIVCPIDIVFLCHKSLLSRWCSMV